ncbi:zinc transport system substrate-binding protein [Lachnospiraceae bacterium RM5]|nr:zinc transport system substrate-binding protein [Lachnospiraceae bacterium RM5]
MIKKIIGTVLICTLLIGCLSGCSAPEKLKKLNSDKIQVVTTIFPEYDWVKNVLGENKDNIDLTLLLDNGVDLHSYQPTTDDILKISTCDMLIYVGGESDGWVEDAIKTAENKDMIVINLLDTLGDKVKEEEIVEGMESEDEEAEEAEEIENDEHVWLSLKNAEVIVDEITDGLCKLDEKNKDSYTKNAEEYKNSLAGLDKKFEENIKESTNDTILVADRFPFRYLVDDYNIKYYAAFAGCMAETEASFETITFLANKIDELKLENIFIIDGSDGKIADTVIKNSGRKDVTVLELNSMQSVTNKDISNGMDYLSIMEYNLSVLEEALK